MEWWGWKPLWGACAGTGSEEGDREAFGELLKEMAPWWRGSIGSTAAAGIGASGGTCFVFVLIFVFKETGAPTAFMYANGKDPIERGNDNKEGKIIK